MSMSAACRIVLAQSVVFLAGLAGAAEPPASPVFPLLTEATRRGWLRPRIIGGRIDFSGRSIPDQNRSGERLRIQVADGEVTASYTRDSPDQELLIEVAAGRQLRIRRTPKGDSGLVPVEFWQAPGWPLRLTVGPPDREQDHVAASLWHLFILQPEACRQQLLPLLSVLDERWDLAGAASEVEAELVRMAAEGQEPDTRRWDALVAQLGDDRFSRRRSADRQLRALGRVVLAYLEQLDSRQLDAEQEYRVGRIIEALHAGTDDDVPSEIAQWLAGDPVIWWAMLDRDEEPTRRLAARRLGALLGGPIAFDPAADAATRRSQIEHLRSRIVNR
jgi:hypothetical protein